MKPKLATPGDLALLRNLVSVDALGDGDRVALRRLLASYERQRAALDYAATIASRIADTASDIASDEPEFPQAHEDMAREVVTYALNLLKVATDTRPKTA